MKFIRIFTDFNNENLKSSMKKILFLFGTRPEAIKMAPLIKCFSADSRFEVTVAVTAQHREMLDQVLFFFDIKVDYDLNIMTANQSLADLTAALISKITTEILLKNNFDFVFIQGDTTTVLAAAISAFYQKIKIVHIEAGLRSFDMNSPFPEEMNRVLTSKLADFHFCPTENSKQNLISENITKNVFIVGNTVIDALKMGLENLKTSSDIALKSKYHFIDFTKKIVLITCHRRENFGVPFEQICNAILNLSSIFETEIQIIYPVHLNPNIQKIAYQKLIRNNIKLIAPLEYSELIWMMDKSHIILTDSGGIQEEAPSIGKPVLVLRDVTERPEGVTAGAAILVGSNENKIVSETSRLINDVTYYNKISKITNPYGDGTTSMKILEIISNCI